MITVNLYYKGTNGSARRFAEEMEQSGTVDAIRREPGNLRYQYFQPLDDPETVLLIDSWTDQAAIDEHHASPMMAQLAALREKYDLHMTVERFVSDELGEDERFIREEENDPKCSTITISRAMPVCSTARLHTRAMTGGGTPLQLRMQRLVKINRSSSSSSSAIPPWQKSNQFWANCLPTRKPRRSRPT